MHNFIIIINQSANNFFKLDLTALSLQESTSLQFHYGIYLPAL